MPAIDIRQIDGKFYLWFEGELLGEFESLRAVADEMLKSVIPKYEKELKKNERNDSECTN